MNDTRNPFAAPTATDSDESTGTSVWKIVAIVIAMLIVASMIGPIVKAAFWIALVILAVIGGYTLVKAKS